MSYDKLFILTLLAYFGKLLWKKLIVTNVYRFCSLSCLMSVKEKCEFIKSNQGKLYVCMCVFLFVSNQEHEIMFSLNSVMQGFYLSLLSWHKPTEVFFFMYFLLVIVYKRCWGGGEFVLFRCRHEAENCGESGCRSTHEWIQWEELNNPNV